MNDIKKHRLHLLLSAALLILLSACQSFQSPNVRAFTTATPTRTPTRTPVPTRKASPTPALSPTPRPTRTPTKIPTPVDLFELLKAGSVEVSVVVEDISYLGLSLESNVDYPLSVRIPTGTLFFSKSSQYPDLISTETEISEMDANGRDTLNLDVALTHIGQRIPDEDVDYSVLTSSRAAELIGVAELEAALPFLEEAELRYESNQALIWILTDDASYEELGKLVRIGGPTLFNPFPLDNPRRVIDAVHIVEAFQVLDKAGIDVTGRKIWLDRDTLAGELEGSNFSTLHKWLLNYIENHTN